jgi:hypothetical protein
LGITSSYGRLPLGYTRTVGSLSSPRRSRLNQPRPEFFRRVQGLARGARNLANTLEDLGDKIETIPEKKRQFLDACESCVTVIEELDKFLIHYNGLDTKSITA